MGLDERLFWLCLGMVIGLVVGEIIRSLRELRTKVDDLKEELDDVDETVHRKFSEDEPGFIDVGKALLFSVVILTVLAAFFSQKASNRSNDALAEQKKITSCTQELLADALNALNQRSTYTVGQTQANVDLQKDTKKFLALLLHVPPYGPDRQYASAQEYFESVTSFIDLANKSIESLETNDYPEAEDLTRCVSEAKETGEPNGAQ